MPMIGADRHRNRLRKLFGPELTKAANRVVYWGADQIRAEAHRSISAGSVSGKNHVPSSPGEPPNRDTGNLQAHIEAVNVRPLVAEVRSEAEYAGDLEFGTSKVAARPYMRPARDKTKPEIDDRFAKEMTKLVRKSGQ